MRLAFWRRRRHDEELSEEIKSHLTLAERDSIESGKSLRDARSSVLHEFGSPTIAQELTREQRRSRWIVDLTSDICYGLRMLRKGPGFTIVAVLTLALGIGANTAIFSAINAVLLRPLAYRDADRLVTVWQTAPGLGLRDMPVSEPALADFRSQSRKLTDFEALYLNNESYNITGRGDPERVSGMNVSAGVFTLLGVRPELGRVFVEGEDQPGRQFEVILSHKLWVRKFGGDPGIVGQRATIDGKDFTIIGVMPSTFAFPPPMVSGRLTVAGNREMWMPFVPLDPSREDHGLGIIARLKPGATVAAARNELDTIGGRLKAQYPKTDGDLGATVEPLADMVVGGAHTTLEVLLVCVSLVLLIACINVANLLLARSVTRRRELALRTALGAGRTRLFRQLLTESALLSAIGGTLGILLAAGGMAYLRAEYAVAIPRLNEISLDWRVLGFCGVLSILTGILCSAVPLSTLASIDVNDCLKEGARGSAGRVSVRLFQALVVGEITLAMVPLISSGLLIRSFERLQSVNPGFASRDVLSASLRLSRQRYISDTKIAEFATSLVEEVRAIPGVIAVGTTNSLPVAGFEGQSYFFVVGRAAPRTFAETPLANERAVTAGYFEAMQIPLLSGRGFSVEDRAVDADKVVLINETAARLYFSGVNPVGQVIKVDSNSAKSPMWSVVGVVGDVHQLGLAEAPEPELYFLETQRTWSTLSLVVRTSADPRRLIKAIQQSVWNLDKDQPVYDFRTMADVLDDSTASRRFSLSLMSVFALIALALTTIGVYGVSAYVVAQRTNEIAIRMAFGAHSTDIYRRIASEAIRLALIGVTLGAGGAFIAARVMGTLLFEVRPMDPAVYLIVGIILFLIAVVGYYIPARRATTVSPTALLRHE